ncbi:MAG TPA: right-handed parallel beta-helix repeat-containing protein [Candidatus Binatia bacterium]|jgi:predicted outer membrane repeat protein
MNYYGPACAVSADKAIFSAWDTQVKGAADAPWLERLLAERGNELFTVFALRYNELRVLPRNARRALQRSLARSRDSAAVPSEWRRKLAYSLAGAAFLLALGLASAQADTITVSSKTLPEINNGDGKCSLFEAIRNANDISNGMVHIDCAPGDPSGADTIVLPKGTQTLTRSYNTAYGTTGVLLITSEITIQGNKTKIIRKKGSPQFRLFTVAATGDLTLNGVTLSGGNGGQGGAIRSDGILVVNNSTISGNSSSQGGAIISLGDYLGINNCIITSNTATYGGAIASYGATVLIDNSTISKNSAASSGGGIRSRSYIRITDSIITGNHAGAHSGGIYNTGNGTLVIDDSTISKNSAGSGGGVLNNHSFTITNSVISGNTATSRGGGVYNGGDFELFSSTGNIFTKNKAPLGPDVFP